MESHDAEFAGRPTLKPGPVINPSAMRPYGEPDDEELRFQDEFRREFMQWIKAENAGQSKREPDPAWVRACALGAAATAMAGPTANEDHIIGLAKRFERYIRNG